VTDGGAIEADLTPPSGRRRGRPPATDSADTKRAILDAARRLFAERGYGAVTNKDVATAAGITTGALYHYVESKLDLYL
jgi:AcrR family transcriptional regulator